MSSLRDRLGHPKKRNAELDILLDSVDDDLIHDLIYDAYNAGYDKGYIVGLDRGWALEQDKEYVYETADDKRD